MQALGALQDPRAILPLKNALNDCEKQVRAAARAALDALGEMDSNQLKKRKQ